MCFSILKVLLISVVITISLINHSVATNNLPIKQIKQIKQDVLFLADNALKGRGNFSPELSIAADYISERFTNIGLTPLNNSDSFQQNFDLYHSQPKQISVELNQQVIATEKIILISGLTKFHWDNTSHIHIHYISATDYLTPNLNRINQQGGQHLVLISEKHQHVFQLYRQYFQAGFSKLTPPEQGAIVLVLTKQQQVINLNISASVQLTTKSLTNVIGVLPGKQFPEQYIIFSGHYDHLGSQYNNNQEHIFNGADDNASGTAAMINLAQYYANKSNNARSVIFVAFSGEEIGGFGSRYLAKKLVADNIIAMINIEMIGKASVYGTGTVWMTGSELSNLAELFNKTLVKKQMKIYPDPYPKLALFYRSDNISFAKLGVPAHTFSSSPMENNNDYHQSTDTVSTLNFPAMYSVIKTLAIASQQLIDAKITPDRIAKITATKKGKIF